MYYFILLSLQLDVAHMTPSNYVTLEITPVPLYCVIITDGAANWRFSRSLRSSALFDRQWPWWYRERDIFELRREAPSKITVENIDSSCSLGCSSRVPLSRKSVPTLLRRCRWHRGIHVFVLSFVKATLTQHFWESPLTEIPSVV